MRSAPVNSRLPDTHFAHQQPPTRGNRHESTPNRSTDLYRPRRDSGDPAPVAAAGTRTVVVDDDRAQCPRAEYTDIQSAIAAVNPGATIKVCGGSYGGDLTIGKSVNLMAQNPAGPDVDCLGGGAIGAGASVINGTVTVTETGSGTAVDGFVIRGADTGIATSDEGSGYRLRRNVIEGNGTFGIDLRSAGGQTSTVERNCIRGNGANGTQGWRVGIIGDFGVLRDTVIRDNTSADNGEAISVAGPFVYSNISITKNVIRRGDHRPGRNGGQRDHPQ